MECSCQTDACPSIRNNLVHHDSVFSNPLWDSYCVVSFLAKIPIYINLLIQGRVRGFWVCVMSLNHCTTKFKNEDVAVQTVGRPKFKEGIEAPRLGGLRHLYSMCFYISIPGVIFCQSHWALVSMVHTCLRALQLHASKDFMHLDEATLVLVHCLWCLVLHV